MSKFPKRRAALFALIEQYLDAGYREGNGEWPEPTDEDMKGLVAIVRQLIDLKFEPDYSGASVIAFEFVSRKRGRLVSTMVPHGPDRPSSDEPVTEDAQLEYAMALSRAAKYLIGSGDDVLRLSQHAMQDISDERKKRHEFLRRCAVVRDMMRPEIGMVGDFVEVSRAIDELGNGDPDALDELKDLYRKTFAHIFGGVENILLGMVEMAGDDPVALANVRAEFEKAFPQYGFIGLSKAHDEFNAGVRRRREAGKAAGDKGAAHEQYFSSWNLTQKFRKKREEVA